MEGCVIRSAFWKLSSNVRPIAMTYNVKNKQIVEYIIKYLWYTTVQVWRAPERENTTTEELYFFMNQIFALIYS